MTTYWLTAYECTSCHRFAETKLPMYPSAAQIRKAEAELERMQDIIISSLKSEPSNGWPGPNYENSYNIGLVKIQVRKTRAHWHMPYDTEYELRCYLCGFRIAEEAYRKSLGISSGSSESTEDSDQSSLDSF